MRVAYFQPATTKFDIQLALRVLHLVVQAPQHTFGRLGVVVLHKMHVHTGGLREGTLVKAFVKKTAVVAKHLGLNQHYIGNGTGSRFH